MIFGKIEQIGRYKGLHKNLDTLIAWIEAGNLDSFSPGHVDLDGNDVYVNCFDYETVPASEAVYEGHKHFADLHLVTAGAERIGIGKPEQLELIESKPENDFYRFQGPVEFYCPLTAGNYAIVFPEDAHQVKVLYEESSAVRKVVGKFRLD